MRDMAAGPRVLLKRLRELMAEALEPQERLDRIVHDIAQNMVAEVCSLYVLRADSVLELYATEGLNPGAGGRRERGRLVPTGTCQVTAYPDRKRNAKSEPPIRCRARRSGSIS